MLHFELKIGDNVFKMSLDTLIPNGEKKIKKHLYRMKQLRKVYTWNMHFMLKVG